MTDSHHGWKASLILSVNSRMKKSARRGEMSEISQAALFLASDASSYTTGSVIDVNGGFFAV